MPYPARRRRSSSAPSRSVRSRTSAPAKKKSWRKKLVRGKKGFAKAVKAVVLSTAESKFRSCDIPGNSAYDALIGGYALNHNSNVQMELVNNNSPATANITYIPAGDSDETRSGNEIFSVGIMLRGSIVIPADRKNARFRIFLLEYNSVVGDPTVYSQFYHNITGRNVLDPIRNDRWTAKPIGTYYYKAKDTSSDPVTGNRGTILIKKWIPWRRQLTYSDGASYAITKGMKERVSLIVQTWDNNSAFDTTTCGYIRLNATLHFKDP